MEYASICHSFYDFFSLFSLSRWRARRLAVTVKRRLNSFACAPIRVNYV